jgi:hypothetical protein
MAGGPYCFANPSEKVICENLALVPPIAVVAASAIIENSRCKFFATASDGFMTGLPYRPDVRRDGIKSAAIVTIRLAFVTNALLRDDPEAIS